jgi:hypothetical protein
MRHGREREEEPVEPIVYRQNSRDVVVECLDDTLAVRYRPETKERVREELMVLGDVTPVESQRLLIVRLPDAAKRAAVMAKLKEWEQQGVIEFVTPVLRDPDSRLAQILTDEIIVRFKPDLPPEARETVERKYGVTIARQNEFVPNQYVVKVPEAKGLKTLEVASQLDSETEVEFAAPNFISQHRR